MKFNVTILWPNTGEFDPIERHGNCTLEGIDGEDVGRLVFKDAEGRMHIVSNAMPYVVEEVSTQT